MRDLPFLTKPKPQTKAITATINGQELTVEFPVLGSLKNKELIHIRAHEYQGTMQSQTSRLADAFVSDGIDEASAQRLAVRIVATRMGLPLGLEPSEQRLMLRHAVLIAEALGVIHDASLAYRTRTVTALIANRLEGYGDWSDDDTGNLPEPVIDAVVAFAEQEREGDAPTRSPEEVLESMLAELGKLAPEEPLKPPTGPISTGVVAGSGPEPLSLPPSDSVTSPSPTPSRRSKRASAG